MYKKFLIIAGRKIWKAVAEHKFNCWFAYLGERAVLTVTDIEVLHFKKKKKIAEFIHKSLLPR